MKVVISKGFICRFRLLCVRGHGGRRTESYGSVAAGDYFNCDPVVHTWTYKLDKAA